MESCTLYVLVMSVLLCTCMCNKLKKVEKRLTRLEIRQDQNSVSRREDMLEISDRLDTIENMLNSSLAGLNGFEPAERNIQEQETTHVEGLQTGDADMLKVAFADEKARLRRETLDMKRAIKRVEKNVGNVENSVRDDVRSYIDNLRGQIERDMEKVEESVNGGSENVKTYVDNSFNSFKTYVDNSLELFKSYVDNSNKGLKDELMKSIQESMPKCPQNNQPSTEILDKLADMETEYLVKKNSSCLDHYNNGERMSGTYTIYPYSRPHPVKVFCDMETDGGGWTVFQRRQDGSEDFYRSWYEYASGFGDTDGEFWLGNYHISALTSGCCHELRIDLQPFDGNSTYAKYDIFKMLPKSDNFALEIGGYNGTAGDALSYLDGVQFSTKDRINHDTSPLSSVPSLCHGAWWYRKAQRHTSSYSNYICRSSNLNGRYGLKVYTDGYKTRARTAIMWMHSIPQTYYSSHKVDVMRDIIPLKVTEMKLRAK